MCLPSVVEALLDRGADVDVRAPDGSTPLGACMSELVGMRVPLEDIHASIQLLLRRRANVDRVDSRGNLPCLWVTPSGARPTSPAH
jgi:ankyrin repeat protein